VTAIATLLEGTGYSTPCEDLFHELRRDDVPRLVALIASGQLAASDLTFAAECLGDVEPTVAVPLLHGLLSHPEAVVREGAIYGAAEHLGEPWLARRLEDMAAKDESPGVRAAASETLADSELVARLDATECTDKCEPNCPSRGVT